MTNMYALKAKLLKILDFIEDKNDVVFVDYPLHHNIGDLLILLGTINFFKTNSLNIKTYLSTNNTDIELLSRQITPRTTILCHGGGNFGDIYPVHQKLRERIIESFPSNRIIILPQTAFFNDEDNQEHSKNLFNKHDNVVLFARDMKTYEIFKQFSTKTYLMPDMAHEMYKALPKSNSQEGILYFLRNDKEQSPLPMSLQQEVKNHDCYDWHDLLTRNDYKRAYPVHKLIQINSKLQSTTIDKLIFGL